MSSDTDVERERTRRATRNGNSFGCCGHLNLRRRFRVGQSNKCDQTLTVFNQIIVGKRNSPLKNAQRRPQ